MGISLTALLDDSADVGAVDFTAETWVWQSVYIFLIAIIIDRLVRRVHLRLIIAACVRHRIADVVSASFTV